MGSESEARERQGKTGSDLSWKYEVLFNQEHARDTSDLPNLCRTRSAPQMPPLCRGPWQALGIQSVGSNLLWHNPHFPGTGEHPFCLDRDDSLIKSIEHTSCRHWHGGCHISNQAFKTPTHSLRWARQWGLYCIKQNSPGLL